jgi:hypothetical protein
VEADVAVKLPSRLPELRSRTALVDLGLAALIALIVIVVSSGLAFVAVLALVVLLIVLISFGVEAAVRRRRVRRDRVRKVGRAVDRSYHH